MEYPAILLQLFLVGIAYTMLMFFWTSSRKKFNNFSEDKPDPNKGNEGGDDGGEPLDDSFPILDLPPGVTLPLDDDIKDRKQEPEWVVLN